MIDIYNISILDLLPPNLKQDPDMKAASKAVDGEFSLIVNEVKDCIILPRIDELNSNLVDLLAWEMHIDFYDTTLPIEIRRELVKNSLKWHQRKGTPSAVEELISTVFDSGQVIEWFENGGQPYYFQVVTNNETVTIEKAEQFTKALNSVKNARSWLDKVIITESESMNLYFAGVVHSGDFITVSEVA